MKLLTKELTKFYIIKLRTNYGTKKSNKNDLFLKKKINSYNNLAGYRCFSTNKNGDNFNKGEEQSEVAVFENNKIRRIFDEKRGTWYFSVIDVISLLTEKDYKTAQTYWRVLKYRLKKEGSDVVTKCNVLKLPGADGKKYLTDVADSETLFRLIQSVPSPKAEPFKLWLAKVGYERVQEIADPEISLNRARENWKKHGRSEVWIEKRMRGQETRNQLTDYWKDNQIKEGKEFAILTNLTHEKTWSGESIKDHKTLKGLKNQNLRDHMTTSELLFTELAELTTLKVAEKMKAKGLEENKKAAREGGELAEKARLDFETKTGQKVISSVNFLKPKNQIAAESTNNNSSLSENIKNNKDLLGVEAPSLIPNKTKLEPAQSSNLEEKKEKVKRKGVTPKKNKKR